MTEVDEKVWLEEILDESPACELVGELCTEVATWVCQAHCTQRLSCDACKKEGQEQEAVLLLAGYVFECYACKAFFARLDWRPL